jgi:hypothetical protein
MSSFTVRVELLQASFQDYTNLHFWMGIYGFTRTIRGDDGVEFDLMPAEYNLEGSSLTCLQVRQNASTAISLTGRPGRVLVTEALSRAWELVPVGCPALPPYRPNALVQLLRG